MQINTHKESLQGLRTLPQPEPMPNMLAYEQERELCLAADPRRRENYERYLASSRRIAQVNYLPIKLDLEPVSRCNFRCTMCQVSEWEKMTRARDMGLEEFKQVLDEQFGLVEIKLQGMGEALMNAEPFFDMIRYARARHIWVRVTTNASLLHLKNYARDLIDTDVNEVQISIDGATEDVFTGIRRGSVFRHVMDNCKKINAYCAEKGTPRTKMWTVVQEANFHQLIDLVDLAHELGFVSQAFSLNLADFGQQNWRDRNDSVTVERKFDLELAHSLIERGRKLGVKVSFWSVSSKYSTRSPESLCPWPFERAYVSSDMRTVPCCMIANPDVCEISPGKGFTEAWKDTEYAKFRQAHLEGNIPPICRGCYG
jgi:pyrroloquinoline quinone biosynthesis protein E